MILTNTSTQFTKIDNKPYLTRQTDLRELVLPPSPPHPVRKQLNYYANSEEKSCNLNATVKQGILNVLVSFFV